MSKCRYSKIKSPSEGYVSYYQNSNHVSFTFDVHFNNEGEVDYISRMQKMESKDDKFYVADKIDKNDITEEEFNEALFKTMAFIAKGCTLMINL